jgi:hypothetical protein
MCERGDYTQSRSANLKGILRQFIAVLKIALLKSDRLTLRKSTLGFWGARVDHDEAVRTLATEKYLLGEMCFDLREEFEMHLFDCEQCAFDLWAAVTFLAHAKAILSKKSEAPFS